MVETRKSELERRVAVLTRLIAARERDQEQSASLDELAAGLVENLETMELAGLARAAELLEFQGQATAAGGLSCTISVPVHWRHTGTPALPRWWACRCPAAAPR
jgi:hypothetical protein